MWCERSDFSMGNSVVVACSLTGSAARLPGVAAKVRRTWEDPAYLSRIDPLELEVHVHLAAIIVHVPLAGAIHDIDVAVVHEVREIQGPVARRRKPGLDDHALGVGHAAAEVRVEQLSEDRVLLDGVEADAEFPAARVAGTADGHAARERLVQVVRI